MSLLYHMNVSLFVIFCDPDQSMMVLQSSLATLPMTCRGGEHCCARNGVKLCSLNEGDCDSDLDCEGSLVCGDNNCPQSVRTMKGENFEDILILNNCREASGTLRMTAALQSAPHPLHVTEKI